MTLGSSGSTYTAPANGWYRVYEATSSKAGSYIGFENNATGMSFEQIAVATGNVLTGTIPAKKGEKVTINYAGVSNSKLMFIYAEGVPSA